MKQFSVSVVIPNYNYGRFLAKAIESVLQQTYHCKEIIIVDDGSTDDSIAVTERYGNRVNLIRQQNFGVGVARNRGAQISTGDIIAFLDADDYWQQDKISKQVAVFTNNPEIGLVSCALREFDMTGKTLLIHEGSNENDLSKILTFEQPIICSGSAITVKRDVFIKAGGFDERKELHPSEDWEFYYRVSSLSKTTCIQEPLVNYRNHGGNGHLKIRNMERAMKLVYKKIFSTASPEIYKLKSKSYGNLYVILSGSYFHAGKTVPFFRSFFKSLWYNPFKLMYFLSYPIRRMKRAKTSPYH